MGGGRAGGASEQPLPARSAGRTVGRGGAWSSAVLRAADHRRARGTTMLNDASVHATIPVRDLQVAQKFYETTLGLTRVEEKPVGIVYQSGGTKVLVYQSEHAGTNQATTASWEVDDPD